MSVATPQSRSTRPLQHLLQQFARPSGWLGHVAGWFMSRTSADDRWVVDLLAVQRQDRVLDVGSGPGVTLALLAERAPDGLVAGIDPSEVMVRQAARRNRGAIRQGRVEVRLGSVSAVPYPTGQFTRVCAVHSVYFWPSLEEGLREVRRVLAPGGRLVLAVRMRKPDASVFDPSHYGLTDDDVANIVATLRAVGFDDVSVTSQADLDRQVMTAILATRRQ
jgi:SAM-dependent methyltransferase